MADLETTLETHRQAVADFLAAARAVPGAQWTRPRAPGKWSPGQVAEHVMLAYEANRRVLHGDAPGATAPRFLRPLIRRFLLQPVLDRGRFFPGSKSSKVFRPSAPCGFRATAGDPYPASSPSIEPGVLSTCRPR